MSVFSVELTSFGARADRFRQCNSNHDTMGILEGHADMLVSALHLLAAVLQIASSAGPGFWEFTTLGGPSGKQPDVGSSEGGKTIDASLATRCPGLRHDGGRMPGDTTLMGIAHKSIHATNFAAIAAGWKLNGQPMSTAVLQ